MKCRKDRHWRNGRRVPSLVTRQQSREESTSAEHPAGRTDARIAVLTEVAAELDVTPNQLVISWLLHRTDPELVTLIGPGTPEQLETALAPSDIKLSADQLDRLDKAGA